MSIANRKTYQFKGWVARHPLPHNPLGVVSQLAKLINVYNLSASWQQDSSESCGKILQYPFWWDNFLLGHDYNTQ